MFKISRCVWTQSLWSSLLIRMSRNFLTILLEFYTSSWRWNKPKHDKTNKVACAPSADSDQPGMPSPGWSESPLGAQFILLVLSCCCSNSSRVRDACPGWIFIVLVSLNLMPNSFHLDHSVFYQTTYTKFGEYTYRNFPKLSDRQVWANRADPDQIRRAVWSGSTLFSIPSASFGCITLRKRHLVQLLGWLQQMFWVSEYLGYLRYWSKLIEKD